MNILCKNIKKFLRITLKDKIIMLNFSFSIKDFDSIKELQDSIMLSLIKNQTIRFKDKLIIYLDKSC